MASSMTELTMTATVLSVASDHVIRGIKYVLVQLSVAEDEAHESGVGQSPGDVGGITLLLPSTVTVPAVGDTFDILFNQSS